jgi:ABC-type uncharacterized transport system permease subunit
MDLAAAWLGWGTPLASAGVTLVAALIWQRGLRRYRGAGHR